ncbi:MAG: BREX system Lon protease-like protein BrxL, partial [Desulfobacteraceae bacterium]
VAFDEFAGRKKKVNKALVDIMKNYMANKSFSRGIETLGAEASMVFVGNTQHTIPYMLKHSDLFSELPDKFYDSAFLDRVHFYIPGWEVAIIRGEMFSDGYGFVVDYLAEILRFLRNHDYSDRYSEFFSLSADISTRDRDSIQKTFSGLMKILFPHGGAAREDVDMVLRFAIEGRKRVKDQLMRMDTTYSPVNFSYSDALGTDATEKPRSVTTLEEEEYPKYYYKTIGEGEGGGMQEEAAADILGEDSDIQREEQDIEKKVGDIEGADQAVTEPKPDGSVIADDTLPAEQHVSFQENQKGISFDTLLGPYIKGATRITVTDPYIRLFYQMRNFMEFLETVVKQKPGDDEVAVHLVTIEDEFKGDQQKDNFMKMQESAGAVGINFTWEFDSTGKIHARHIVTDHGWKISLDRGLDIFQHYEMNDTFMFANRLQQFRPCKAFEITFLKMNS